MINFVITLSKWLRNHEPQASGSAANLDNVIFKKRTDKKLTSNLFLQ